MHHARRALRIVHAAVGFGLVTSTAMAADRTWLSTGGGTFTVNTNWSASTVPGPADNAIFALNSTGYTVTVASDHFNNSMQMRSDSVTFSMPFTTYTLTSAGNGVQLGTQTGETARLQLNGGTLTANNAALGNQVGAIGMATITSSSILRWNTANIGAIGAGSISILNGGDAIGVAVLGQSVGATGFAMIDGTGSTWSGTSLAAGQLGTGTLNIQNSGNATFNSVLIGNLGGSSGVLNISSAGVLTSSSSAILGSLAGSTGMATVTGSGSAMNLNQISVGSSGNGSLLVLAGADVAATSLSFVGRNATGFGEALVDGTGTTLTTPSVMSVGDQGRGELVVSNGAAASFGSLTIGLFTGANGNVSISNAGASVTATNGAFIGGNDLVAGGVGNLSINPQASFNTGAAGVVRIWSSGAVHLNGGSLSIGSIDLQGGALNWNSGTININGSAGLNIGAASPFGATLTLDNSRFLRVANAATLSSGAMLVMDGGSALMGSLNVSSGGQLVLQDITSTLTAASVNNAGLISGDGRINGPVNNSGELRTSANQRLTLASLSSNTGSITNSGGIFEVTGASSNSGRISGRGSFYFNGGLTNVATLTQSAGISDVFGTITNNSGGKIIVTGGGVSTYYDAIINNAGAELRVSPTATAVFYGPVTGTGAITGSGLKIFEFNGASVGGIVTTGSTRVESGATVTADHIRENNLSIGGTVNIRPNGTDSGVSRLATLVIDGGATPTGTFDLSNNDLIVQATAQSEIEAYIAFARNFGNWDQPGLTSSAAATAIPPITTLGAISGLDYASTGNTTFGGFTIADTDTLVKYTWYGDTDFNGVVDFDDYVRIDGGFNSTLTGWFNGDFDFSGTIDFDDYVLIDSAFNSQNGTLIDAMNWLEGEDRSTENAMLPGVRMVAMHFEQFGIDYANAFYASVPEPTSTGLVALTAAMARRRRRN